MKKSQFYLLIALIWIVLILSAFFSYEFYVDVQYTDCVRDPPYIDGLSPFSCSQDLFLGHLMDSIFWGIFSTAILYSIIDIEDDEEEE